MFSVYLLFKNHFVCFMFQLDSSEGTSFISRYIIKRYCFSVVWTSTFPYDTLVRLFGYENLIVLRFISFIFRTKNIQRYFWSQCLHFPSWKLLMWTESNRHRCSPNKVYNIFMICAYRALKLIFQTILEHEIKLMKICFTTTKKSETQIRNISNNQQKKEQEEFFV